MIFKSILDAPFRLEGLAVAREGLFLRLPEDLIDRVNEQVALTGRFTSGACVRFRTDASAVTVKASLIRPGVFGAAGACKQGADVYFDGRFAGTACTGDVAATEYCKTLEMPWFLEKGAIHDVRVELPLSNAPTHMEIGLEEGAALLPPAPHRVEKPVVFYGSSITNGFYASRPGCAYPVALARRLDFELIDLGFSSGAHGEQAMAEYIAGLDMSVFVLDYDHNDNDPSVLAQRHEPFFMTVREKHPALPVIIISRPDFEKDPRNGKTRGVVRATYEHAQARGDRNVFFIDGESFYGTEDRDAFTIDRIHPNDAGMHAMAEGIRPILSRILFGK